MPKFYYATPDASRARDNERLDAVMATRPLAPPPGRPALRVATAAVIDAAKAAKRAAKLPRYQPSNSDGGADSDGDALPMVTV